MGRSRSQRVLASSIVIALATASLASAPMANAENSNQEQQLPSAKTVHGSLAKPPDLSLAVNALGPGRLGGSSKLVIEMASTTPGGHSISGLEVRVAVPQHARLLRIGGSQWNCRLDDQASSAMCAHPRTLGRDERPSPIKLKLGYREGIGRVANVTAWARWDEATPQERKWLTSAQARVSVLPRLKMSLRATTSTVTTFVNGESLQRQVFLQAKLGELRDESATLTWKQVKGPRVKFLLPRVVEDVPATVDQRIEVPKLRRNQRYVFAARVKDQGASITRRVSVRTRGAELLRTVDPAMPSSARIAAATRLAPLKGSLKISSDHEFRINGPTLAPAGRDVELRVAGSGVNLADTVWTIDGEEIGRGQVAVVTVPTAPGEARSVEATTTSSSGVVLITRHLVVADIESASADQPVDPSAAKTSFCRIATSVRDAQRQGESGTRILPLGTTQRFEFQYESAKLGAEVFASGGACTGNGEISISDATLFHSKNIRLGQIDASLTATSLTINAARMSVNSTVSNRLTDRIGLRLNGELTSSLLSEKFSLVEGSMNFEPISIGDRPGVSPFSMFLDLPTGWDFLPDASRVYFLNAGSSGIDASVAEGTVRIVQIASSPLNGAGERGQVALGVDVLEDAPTQVSVTVANLALGQTPKGGQLVANGHVGMQLSEKKFTLALNVECGQGWQSPECRLVTGLRFSSFTMDWSDTELRLAAEAAVDLGGDAFPLKFGGSYRSNVDWDLEVKNPEPWELGKGMRFEDLKGSLISRASASDPTAAVLTMNVTGSLRGLSLSDSIDIDDVTPQLTNACPSDDAKCSTKELKFFLAAAMSADVPWSNAPIRFDARGKLNATSMSFRFESGVSDLDVGPEELNLQELRVVVSNEEKSLCAPKSVENADPPVDPFTVQFIGRARILSKNFTLNVQSDSRGLCIWGSGESINIGGGLKAVDPLMTYATYADGANITNIVDGVSENVEVKPNTVAMRGGFEFPDTFKERFKIPGKGVVFDAELATDLTSGHFTVAYNAAGEIVLYQGAGSNLALGSIGFGADYSLGAAGKAPSFDGYFYGTGHLNIEASGSAPASSTEMAVRVGVGYSGTAFNLMLQAGVPSDVPVENAFGIEGLTVRALSASAVIDLVSGTPAFGLNADVTLPPSLLKSVGIKAGTPVALAANLSLQSPCFEFRVGTTGGPTVVDLADLGLITGTYLRILYAPIGCKVPDGYQMREIDEGWSLALEGTLLGGPVTLASTFTYSAAGFAMNTTVRLPNWNLYGVALQSADGTAGPKFVIDINTETGVFNVEIDAAIEIGKVSAGRGILVSMDGDITLRPDRFVVDLNGKGNATLGPVQLALDPVSLDANIPRLGQENAENRLYVAVSTELLASLYFTEIRASGDLKLIGSTVVDLTVKGSGVFNLAAYEVRGTVSIDLCVGTLSDLTADGLGSQCTLFAEDKLATSKPALRIGLTGVQKWALADPKPFAKMIYNRVGLEV